MERPHPHWPAGVPATIAPPARNLFFNLADSAARVPGRTALIFYGGDISYARLLREVAALAGYLRQRCGLQPGDRVLLFMQNAPQFVIAYYATLMADGVVVPINPMNQAQELAHYVADSGAAVAIAAQDIADRIVPLIGRGLAHVIVAAYSDYIAQPADPAAPAAVAALRLPIAGEGIHLWSDALAAGCAAAPPTRGPDELAVLPYTSGTTGFPKGCMHTHRSVMHNAVGYNIWYPAREDAIRLAVLPLVHVTGMQSNMNAPIAAGASVAMLARWDRDLVARLVERHRITSLTLITTMLVDFLANPRLPDYDLSSLERVSGGGAAMPRAVSEKLSASYGLDYVEGYGLTETMAATHINPPDRPKRQCLGIPIFGTESLVVDPETLVPLPRGEVGEIVVRGPQVFEGYWRNPQATAEAFAVIGGRRFFRTGDLGRIDEDGYFFLVDRLKRMINAAGYKVWPAEVEAMFYAHPAIREACVIAARDPYRGETVKAVIVLEEADRGRVSAEDIIAWARGRMAAYKVPRIVAFAESLPRTPTAKIDWRKLQEVDAAGA